MVSRDGYSHLHRIQNSSYSIKSDYGAAILLIGFYMF